MQDRYVGDVGDFGKYGLLRRLCGHFDSLPPLNLGVIWYKIPNECHNNDGSKIQYLEAKNAHAFDVCDPELYTALRALVLTGRRSIKDIASAKILPHDTIFYDRVLSFLPGSTSAERLAHRGQWIGDGLRATEDCDIVFVDPDNGLECCSVRPASRFGPKYSFQSELWPVIERGQTLVAYHHTARQAPADVQIRGRLTRLADGFPRLRKYVVALRFRRGNSRAFLIVPSVRHQDYVWRRIESLMASRWRQHFDLVTLSRTLAPVAC